MYRKANFHSVDKVSGGHSTFYRRAFNLVIMLVLIANLGVAGSIPTSAAFAAAAPASPKAPQDTPDTLVASGVTDYTISAPKLFWHTGPVPCPPHIAATPNDQFMDIIGRVAIQGSLPRTIYSLQLVCDVLAGKIYSNVVADDNYLYFTRSDGLYLLSVNANVGDAPQLMNALVSSYAELAIDDTYVYVLTSPDSSSGATVNGVRKDNHELVSWGSAGAYASNLQVSHAFSFINNYTGDYVYWLQNGNLERLNLNTAGEATIETSVTNYHAEGGRTFFSGNFFFFTDLVYFSTGGGSLLKDYSNVSGTTSATIYDANGDSIYSITTDDNNVFFLQEFFAPCSPQPCFGGSYTDYVMRRGRGSGGSTDILYASTPSYNFHTEASLKESGDYIFWQSNDRVLRLPKTAGALPTTNLRITGLEITQGIQKPDNSVRLIKNKRTFVRLFVQSDGPNVPGITATLVGDGTCGALGELLPTNPVGTNITVPASPKRVNLNDSFLFELPWSWTTCGSLNLTGTVNPYHAPPESTYSDNSISSGQFSFSNSPRLQVQFIAWQYVLFNTFHTPQFIRDILETFSWIRRAYPVNSTTGMSTDPSAGFRPGLWFVGDDSLGAKVQGSDSSCQDLLWTDGKGVKHDDRNLCASRYTNQQMVSMRAENGLPDSLFFYGMLADAKDSKGNWVFPRGQACCGTAVSSGPVGADGPSGYFWYNGDGTYADWYAAHEIGHTLGRAHPVTKGVNASKRMCGQSEDDASYPYDYAQIGANDNTEGFDAGDPSLGQPMRVYPGTQWFDVMSYCAEQWISDYTYEGMYQYAIAHPSLVLTGSTPAESAPQAGDWLSVSGTIVSGTDTATINRIRHILTSVTQPPLVPGGYAIRLFNASNAQLASYEFTADVMDGQPSLLTFNQVVAFVAGTTKVEIVKLSDNKVMTSVNVPAHSPSISSVALQGAPNPVSGTVTLGWNASDPDGRPLTFDIYYVRNGNPTPRIIKLDAIGSTASIDTSTLGGSGVFRVIASDGFNTAQANSPTYTMANKPPIPRIDTPADGLHIHYGQLVNFSGEASDPQDGSLTGSSLVWTSDKGAFGATGELASTANLPVGTNLITLTASNSVGLSAHVTITVYVDDNLSLLDPTLTVGPAQFGWTFPAGSTTPQSSTLNINNAGGGTLNWTASSDSAWLKLDMTSGTAPSSITVTADPTGISNGTGLSGKITIIAASSTQTITIPAGIVVGDLMEKPSFNPQHLYLPLTKK